MTPDAKGELAIRLLPRLLPQSVYRSSKKSVRHSAEEARAAFVDLKPVGTNIVEYLSLAEGRPPSVLVLGGTSKMCCPGICHYGRSDNPGKYTAWAVDVCFKSFYVFDIDYPKQCTHPW